MTAAPLRAPFPYFGYKGKVSSEVWKRLGNPPNYVEPFAGSLAVLLQRPVGAGPREVVNDRYGLLANFWRAVKAAPAAVLQHAMHPSSESDLHARNAFCRASIETLTPRLEGDPEYHDARLAGYWCYVQCCAIGEAAYAKGPWVSVDGMLVPEGGHKGIRRAVPCDMSRGIQRAIPFHSRQGLFSREGAAAEWLERLAERLQGVRILCGDWSRAVKPTYTVQHGLTGVFLDPPYDTDYKTYANADPLMGEICKWCAFVGRDPKFRVALCGYADTLSVDLLAHGWAEYEWKSGGGRITTGGQSDLNRELERIWFSPHCLDSFGRSEQLSLLDLEEAGA